MKGLLKIAVAVLRQVIFPYDVYKRSSEGDIIRDIVEKEVRTVSSVQPKRLMLAQPVPSIPGTWIARIISIATTIYAIYEAAQQDGLITQLLQLLGIG